MESNEWNTIKSIVSRIIEAPEDEQSKLLEQAALNNPTLSESLKVHYKSIIESDGFWNETIEGNSELIQGAIDLDAFDTVPVVEYKSGSRIGAYILDEQIGEGGMGIVFKAHRADGQFERTVAIKLMALHIQFEVVKKRFEQEQKILASLNHSHIAQLYDAGVTVAGNPYLVMEFVKGEDVLSYAKRKALSFKDRVALFLKICDAVEFAHRNLIIHRDLKPPNILVTDEGNLKVLDFGIAKLLTDSMDSVTESITQHQQRIYSLSYASPEQVLGNPINTSTDVYTLGLLLHELISDRKFFEMNGLSRKEAEEMVINQHVEKSPEKDIELNPDVEAIIQKAIRVEPNSRYGSVTDLQTDLTRFLNNEPVLARKGSTIYKFSKFWKRNKGAVSTTTAFFMVAISFFVFYTIQITNERKIAEQEAEKAQLVTDYLIGLFEQADPTGEQGRDQTVADFVQQSIDDLSGLENNPILQQEAAHTLAKVTLKLQNYTDSEILYNRALTLAKSNNSDASTLATLTFELGELKESSGRYRDALTYFQSAKSILDKAPVFDAEFEFTVTKSMATAHAHIGDIDQAEILLESLFSTIRTNDEAAIDQRISLLSDLADIVRESGNFEASVQFDSEALELLTQYQPEEKELSIIIQNNLGFALKQLNKLEDALKYYNASLVEAEALYGSTHPRVLTLLGNISSLYASNNEYQMGIEIDRQILNHTITAYGENHWRTASAYGGLATSLYNVDDEKAIEMINTSVSIYQSVLGNDHFWTLRQQFRQALIWYTFDSVQDANTLSKATADRLIETTNSPLAYYDKQGLERVLDLFKRNEYELGSAHIEEFFSWYSSNIDSDQ